ncbi:MAG: glycosyltransferase family 2 protein [Chloroflexi bacterium]|nr:glycosyltransferase family 2 protein [Chloroflexota bacterium]MCI0574661.1 glycosyltransferase family 2 protein [Chloroflexota bacterium]MCI0649057.1 glycosyltransferase family 2 protein [Chloroflexota bacterium]MCI0725150.1 glycosyltransferase family 2 protein [Chloroflexota bacterium]
MTLLQIEPKALLSVPAAVDLSIVIPALNEADNLRPLVEEIRAALGDQPWNYEVLFIDDGSQDGSFEVVQALHQEYPQVGGVRFRRNFGQTAAFAAGFAYAQGRVIVTMDADRQNDPADIPVLLARLAEGYDVVNGWRQKRQDGLLRRLPSFLANRLIARSTGVRLRDRGCSLRAFRVEVVRELRLYGEMHRFIPELASAAGFTMAEVPVSHRPRVAGKSKYGLSRTVRVLLDLATILFLRRYSARPMHLFGGLGILSSGLGFLFGLYLAGIKIWAGIEQGAAGFRSVRIGDRPLLMLAVLLIILGVQFLVMGLLAELVVRTYHESQNKPVYHIREIVQSRIGLRTEG